MKLNFDAMRELLLVIEEQPNYIDVNKVVFDDKLEHFEKIELGYALEKMIESHILNGKVSSSKTGSKHFLIDSISLQGHEFLDSIRNENTWTTLKDFIKNKGIATLSSFIPLAIDYFSQ